MHHTERTQTQSSTPLENSHEAPRSKNHSFTHPIVQWQQALGNFAVQQLCQQNPLNKPEDDASSKERKIPLPNGSNKNQTQSRHSETQLLNTDRKAPRTTLIQRFSLDDVLDFTGIGSSVAGPLNLVDKLGFLGEGSSGLLGAAGPALGVAAPALALTSGISSLLNDDADTEESILGGIKTFGGATSLIGKGLLAAGGGTGALGGGSLFGMSAGTALTGGGAGLGTAAGAGATLSSAGAVGLAGAAGYGMGKLLVDNTQIDEEIGDSLFDVLGPGPGLWLADAFGL